MTARRLYSTLDRLCVGLQQTLASGPGLLTPTRPSPAQGEPESTLTAYERHTAANLMRVNHAGEVCAQALYQGHAIGSSSTLLQDTMRQAAAEEGDHLAWCSQRVTELGGHTSYLNPLWYAGSFLMGAVAGAMGERWCLGFLAETESQVVNHLAKHLQLLPAADSKSRKILEQMQRDEAIHRDTAWAQGAVALPSPLKKLMHCIAKCMLKTAYYI